ncbi:MAG: hypothetical protein WAM85_08100 [Terracidiphilus sp.]
MSALSGDQKSGVRIRFLETVMGLVEDATLDTVHESPEHSALHWPSEELNLPWLVPAKSKLTTSDWGGRDVL